MGDPSKLPHITLPIKLDILWWPKESRSKSTAVHAAIVAPECTTFYAYPDIPEYNVDEVLLLFPGENTPSVSDFNDFQSIKRVVFIDSQWHAAGKILRDEKVKKLKTIKITHQETHFWRYQEVGKHCLATIEAIYYFFKEYQQKMTGIYNGEYDNLLFYFIYYYNMIQDEYKQGDRPFPRMEDYVKLHTTTEIPGRTDVSNTEPPKKKQRVDKKKAK